MGPLFFLLTLFNIFFFFNTGRPEVQGPFYTGPSTRVPFKWVNLSPFSTGSLPGVREYNTFKWVNLSTFSTGSLPGERENNTFKWVNLSTFSTGSLPGDREYNTFKTGPLFFFSLFNIFFFLIRVNLKYRVPFIWVPQHGSLSNGSTCPPLVQGPFPAIGNITLSNGSTCPPLVQGPYPANGQMGQPVHL